MKKILFLSFFLLVNSTTSFAVLNEGQPIKFLSSCQMDFDANGKIDIALLIETAKGSELIVLLRKSNSYESHLVTTKKPNMILSCHFGEHIKESVAGKKEVSKISLVSGITLAKGHSIHCY